MIRLKNRFGKANRKEMSWMSDLMETLRQEGISPDLLCAVEEYRAAHALPEALRPRIPVSGFTYYGREVWEQALAALLCGENLLLAGGKATGKNVLAENLAAAFGRPAWDISFHVNMDAASLIGMDTFVDGAVTFRPGPVYRCAQCGGFGVLDEINMAKNEALAVLHEAGDGGGPGADGGDDTHGGSGGVDEVGQLHAGDVVLVGDGTHHGTHGEAVEVVIDEDEHTQQNGSQLRAHTALDVLGGPAAEGGGAARLVH